MNNFEFEYEGKKYWYSRSVAVVGLIMGYKNNRLHILATKRSNNAPDFQGCWCMPCGYVDFNETTEEAMFREILEETGFCMDGHEIRLDSIDSSIEEGDEKQNITIRYIIDYIFDLNLPILLEKEKHDKEVDIVKWIDFDEIDKYDWAFGHNKLIKDLVEKISTNIGGEDIEKE